MKKQIIYLFVLLTGNILAQDSKYMTAMEKNVAILDTASATSTFINVSNGFERISNSNPKEWLPYYYQSYCLTMIGLRQDQNSKKDEYFDKADALIGKADSLNPNNSEIYVVKSFITGVKISIDPATRGAQLGMKSSTYNSQAIQFDGENPRAYMMKGTGLMYTPAQYGGGKDAALPLLEKAVDKFRTFKPASPIMPHWGQNRAKEVLEQCKKM